jgi:hypothetical protein
VASLTACRGDWVDDPEVQARLAQYELAFRMQTSVPALTDLSSEPASVKALYGVDTLDGSFAANCLLARRLAERGVRFIQLYHRDWDHHSRLKADIAMKAREVDRATAALVRDLGQRGMLDDTLVLWGGEFGRTPMAQSDGRDHHIKGFSMLLAGGGIKGGVSLGATDELGYDAVEDVVSVHDLHATMLHLLGIDHTRLTYHGTSAGRSAWTDVHGRVVTRSSPDARSSAPRLAPGGSVDPPRSRPRLLVAHHRAERRHLRGRASRAHAREARCGRASGSTATLDPSGDTRHLGAWREPRRLRHGVAVRRYAA